MDYELKSIVASIVSQKYVDAWINLNPKVYYKDGMPYGLVGTRVVDGITYIASTANDIEHPFTVSMIRYMRKISLKNKVCIITDIEHKHELIKNTLDRYNYRYEYKDGIMYSYNFNKE